MQVQVKSGAVFCTAHYLGPEHEPACFEARYGNGSAERLTTYVKSGDAEFCSSRWSLPNRPRSNSFNSLTYSLGRGETECSQLLIPNSCHLLGRWKCFLLSKTLKKGASLTLTLEPLLLRETTTIEALKDSSCYLSDFSTGWVIMTNSNARF